MKTRMLWLGAAVLLSVTGCQQREGGARLQNDDNHAQQGAAGPGGESGTGTVIPERGVGGGHTEEAEGTGGAGGADIPGLEQGGGTGGEGMKRQAEQDAQQQQREQQGETGDQDD
jgi:hypothetical protein